MSEQTWHYAKADAEGFATFEEIQERAHQISRDEFIQEFPVPGLLVVYHDVEGSGEALDPSNQGVQLLTVSIKSAAILRYLNHLAFVCKRPGNHYAHLISIGRSASNDISIAVDSVSKVHGYFALDEEQWCFTDHNSTNGSLLNEKPVEAGRKNTLRSGDILQLGLEVTLEYFESGSLYDRLTRGL